MNIQATCWPTREQELLLQASLWQGKRAIEAWVQWQSATDMDNLDPGSFRLLPLLYRNLSALGIDEPIMSKLKGIYRQAWYRNQMTFHRIATLLPAFQDAGIQTLLLKGAALTVLHYQDYGLRPMTDIDLLVPTEQTLAAVDLLAKLGWDPKWTARTGFSDTLLSNRHSHTFKDASGHELDLHWHVLYESCYPAADDDFWDGAVTICVQELETRALNPTDQLLHVCVHGAASNFVPPIRWAADAMMILRTSETEIDWDQLVVYAEKRRLSLPMRDSLSYLKQSLKAPIPGAILDSLHNMPVSRFERLVYQATVGPDSPYRFPLRTWMQCVRLERGAGDKSLQPNPLVIPGFLRQRWGLEHTWQVPFYLLVRAGQKIRDAVLA